MKKHWKSILAWMGMLTLLIPELVLAAGEKASLMVIVADTRKLTGWEAWWANLYNESHVYFTIVTVICIPVIGLIFGILADLVMKNIGIDLSSRELAEH
jgi:hypothetical protein